MSVEQPVFPAYGTGVVISTSTTAASGTVPKNPKQLCLTAKTVDCYVRITDSVDTSAATSADFLVPVGTPRTISKNPDHTRISVVAVSGTGTIHVIGADGSTAM